jgi:hypothetical protein
MKTQRDHEVLNYPAAVLHDVGHSPQDRVLAAQALATTALVEAIDCLTLSLVEASKRRDTVLAKILAAIDKLEPPIDPTDLIR